MAQNVRVQVVNQPSAHHHMGGRADSRSTRNRLKPPKGKTFDEPFIGVEQARQFVKPVIDATERIMKASGDPIIGRALNREENALVRLEKGQRADIRTPYYVNLPRPTIVSSYTHFNTGTSVQEATQIMDTVTPDGGKIWSDVEADQAKNIGPQSKYLPFHLDGPKKVKAVMSDKLPGNSVNWDAVFAACRDISGLLPKGSVRHVSLDEVADGMRGDSKTALDPDKYSGYPMFVSNWGKYRRHPNETTEDQEIAYKYYMTKAANQLSDIRRAGKPITLSYVGTTGQRLVQKGPDPLKPNKDGDLKGKRIVIMMPKEEALVGKTIMAPLQEALSKSFGYNRDKIHLIPAWQNQRILDQEMQLFLRQTEAQGRVVVSGDISAFDATLPPWFMWMVAKAMSDWMDLETANVFLSVMRADIYGTSLITPTGVVEATPSSVKSGSIFTSLIGCIANFGIQRYGYHAKYYSISNQCVMGDDFIIDGPGVSAEAIQQAFEDFGMSANAAKQFVEQRCLHFLQRLHVLGSPGGQGSVYRILGNILSLEDDTQMRFDERNKYAYTFQALARLENAVFNPAFTSLVHYIEQGDSMHLCKDLNPSDIPRLAGPYADRKLSEAKVKPWTSTGNGVPFEKWAVNRVLRGEEIPPVGEARFKWYYQYSAA